jgi:trigger factor
LKIEAQQLEDHQVKLTVEVDQEIMDNAKQRAARRIAKRMKIPGFRPGKAPYSVIVRYAGEGVILEEGLDLLIEDIYPKVIEEAAIEPYGPGTLEKVESYDPPILEFVVPLEAEVVLGEYNSIRKPYEPGEITDEDVDDVLANLQEQYAVIEPIEHPADNGNIVTVQIRGNNIFEDDSGEQDQILVPERTVQLLIRSNEMEDHEWPFPGFSKHLNGMTIGEEKQIVHKYADDYTDEKFRGNEVNFNVSVEDIKARILPELNDKFAESLGDYENIEELRKTIKESLESRALESYNEEYDQDILDELIDKSSIVFPPQMLEKQIDNMINNLKTNLEQQNLDIDLYLKTREMGMDDIREETQPVAETRLKRTLVLMELAKSEEIQIDTDDFEHQTSRTLETLRNDGTIENKTRLSEEGITAIAGNVMATMVAERAMIRLREISKGIEEDLAGKITDSSDELEDLNEIQEMSMTDDDGKEDESVLDDDISPKKVETQIIE